MLNVLIQASEQKVIYDTFEATPKVQLHLICIVSAWILICVNNQGHLVY